MGREFIVYRDVPEFGAKIDIDFGTGGAISGIVSSVNRNTGNHEIDYKVRIHDGFYCVDVSVDVHDVCMSADTHIGIGEIKPGGSVIYPKMGRTINGRILNECRFIGLNFGTEGAIVAEIIRKYSERAFNVCVANNRHTCKWSFDLAVDPGNVSFMTAYGAGTLHEIDYYVEPVSKDGTLFRPIISHNGFVNMFY